MSNGKDYTVSRIRSLSKEDVATQAFLYEKHDGPEYQQKCFDDKSTLPFIEYSGEADVPALAHSGYAIVYQKRIHPSHHRFWDKGHLRSILPGLRSLNDSLKIQKQTKLTSAKCHCKPTQQNARKVSDFSSGLMRHFVEGDVNGL